MADVGGPVVDFDTLYFLARGAMAVADMDVRRRRLGFTLQQEDARFRDALRRANAAPDALADERS